jgi:putative NADH-flavin reductase
MGSFMKIALIGATGNIGKVLLAEALGRGHDVTAIVRQPDKLAPQPRLTIRQGDISDTRGLPGLLAGHDAVISSVRYTDFDPRALVDAVKKSGAGRLLVVGGAGNLRMKSGIRRVDDPEFPAAGRPNSLRGIAFLELLQGERDLDWTFLSPAMFINPGERTGKFRLGTDALIYDDKGDSRISREDYAVAMIDELERPAHSRRQFTIGY